MHYWQSAYARFPAPDPERPLHRIYIDGDRDHTEQEDVMKTTLYERRGKSRYRVVGTANALGDKL